MKKKAANEHAHLTLSDTPYPYLYKYKKYLNDILRNGINRKWRLTAHRRRSQKKKWERKGNKNGE